MLTRFCFLLFPLLLSAQTYDLVIANGRVMDPESGLDAVRHVGIRNGKIAALSSKRLTARKTIDATGLTVTAGFIDLHSHGQTPENYRLKARDGVTTALELEIGVPDVAKWYAERQAKALIHFGASVGHVPVRMVVMKDTGDWLPKDHAITKPSSAEDRSALAALIEKGLREGALGIGFGFGYTPKAGAEELQQMFQLAAKHNRVAFVHMRYGSMGEPGAAASVHETLALGLVTGAPVHIVHIGASSTHKFDLAISLVEAARKRGLDVTVESYPYVAGMTRIETAIFDPGFQQRLGMTEKDMLWVATGERLTPETFAKYRKQGGLVATFTNTEEMIRKNIAHPLVMIASDGIMENGKGHPRAAGTYARVLGKYVREEKALSLMDALRKMSLMPAQRLEKMSPAMRNKGRIKVGADADIAVFDAAKVKDEATFAKPDMPSTGIPYVLVNGVPVVENSAIVETVLPGKGILAQ
ncbi:MAG: amidohydrolase family protein [Bryobacterales bacterium]|nr:amidohydrolase family protein [Bryobacterales bacterium]